MFKMCCNKIRKKIYTAQSPKPLRKTKQIFISSSSFIRHFWLWFFYYKQKGKELLSTDNPVWGPNIFLYFFTKCGYHKNCLHLAIPMWAHRFSCFAKKNAQYNVRPHSFGLAWVLMKRMKEKNERKVIKGMKYEDDNIYKLIYHRFIEPQKQPIGFSLVIYVCKSIS